MSRAAVFDAITTDSFLNSIGINDDSVFHNYSLEERPVCDGPFIILRWGDQDRPAFVDYGLPAGDQVKSPVRLAIWVHWPLELTNDYTRLDWMLDQIDDVLVALEDVAGSDNYTVTTVRITGRSADFKDDGFHTISKNAGYEVLSRRS